MTNPTPAKPLPAREPELEPFWDATLEGKLLLKQCSNCGTFSLPYRSRCDACLGPDFDWREASGKGTVATWAVMHQRYHPAFEDEIPYNIAMVELEEGPRLPTNIVGVDSSEIRIGMAVEVAWERHEDLALPKFRPAS